MHDPAAFSDTRVVSAFQVALLQLRKEYGRLRAAVGGNVFAVVLMLVQLGFDEVLLRSSTGLHAPVVMFSWTFRAMNAPSLFQ